MAAHLGKCLQLLTNMENAHGSSQDTHASVFNYQATTSILSQSKDGLRK